MRKVFAQFLLVAIVLSTFSATFAQKALSSSTGKKASVAETATQFASVEAYTDRSGVLLQWQMEVETNNIGFYIYRISGKGRELVSESKLVEGSASRVGSQTMYGERYSFFDELGGIGTPYVIESIMTDGTIVSSETFTPQYTSDLRSVAGSSSAELDRRINPASAIIQTNDLILSKELIREIYAHRSLADPDTHRWAISQPGVRIGVKKEGLYRVPRTQLETAGFDVNSDPNLWRLYAEGVEQAIIVGGTGDYIEFYGKGIDTNETDIRTYFLVAGSTAGKRMNTRVARPGTSTLVAPNYAQTYLKKERTNYIDRFLNGDAENYWGRSVGNLAATLPFSLSGVDFSKPNCRVVVRFQGFTEGQHVVEITLNGQTLPPASATGTVPFSIEYDLPTSSLLEGANTLQMRSIGPAGDFNLFDSIAVSYDRKHVADQNALRFFSQNYKAVVSEGFASANIRLFDLTYEGDPILVTNLNISPTGGTFGFNLPAARPKLLYAVEDSAILQPDSVTPNNPALIGVPTQAADMVIITYKDFAVQAEQWANYRRGQGFTVKVVDVREIYDEFNYGSLSSASIRSFLQYAKNNWQTPPNYVLLMGDASYDSRNYEGLGNFNYVPSPIVNTVFSETASDESLADFNGDGLAEIAIGRIPARDTQTVMTMLNKTMNWESNLIDLNRGALFAYDYPDGWNFGAMSNLLADELPPSMPKTFVYRGEPDANNRLIAAMNTGKYIVNYAGHGTTGSWGGNPVFFNVFSVPLLTNHNNESVFTMLTCLNGYFHNLRNESLAEVLTKYQNGGAVAAWASTGLTTPDVQQVMAIRFYNQIGAGGIPRMGDLIMDAKTTIPGGSDVRLSWALIGDPMLKIR